MSDSDVLWVQARGARGSGTAANDSSTDSNDACPSQLQGFVMFRSSLAREIQAYLAAVGCANAAGGAEWRWALSLEEEKAVQGRRGDLQNATLRSPIIINFPELYTFIDDLRERKRDYRPKTNFPVVRVMAEQANAHMLVFQRWDYGYNRDANGMFDGLMGELQRFECDLLSTAVYVTDERLYVLDSVAETFPLRTGVIYRMSGSSHSAADLYLRPFSRGVWLATFAVSMVCVVQLVASTRSWMTRITLGWDECLTSVIGALCQQGADRTPETVSGRTVMVFVLLLSFFLFTSFSAFIVALLQAPARPLSSPRELLASPLKIGGMDVAFIHAWFRGETSKIPRGVVGDIFVKKIKSHERPAFLPVWEGIELVRGRGYGYQAELNEAYHEIQEKFTQSEKCDLFEMELFPSEAQIIVTVEKSPYREAFSRFVRWQRELGHLDRIAKRWYASRPRCESGARGLTPIGVREVVPLLLLLTYGIALSLLCLAVECLTARHQGKQPTRSLCLRLFGGRPRHLQQREQRPRRAMGQQWTADQVDWPWRPGPASRKAAHVGDEDREPGPALLLESHTLYWQTRGRALGHFARRAQELQPHSRH
ncbi:glutamate receptor ionotropic, kainate 4-like [Frankliniella occidentalis]|uniref:Glutamate receptor ionotropic, kainate 4-like n=1 Tax=Frankliniella occidentalis TaxID=133901 RepID=A0A9C6X6G7_FRAOC|nr:glutamate receptor ionotropic, kainate 4-like [Frankliniella occidentalis]